MLPLVAVMVTVASADSGAWPLSPPPSHQHHHHHHRGQHHHRHAYRGDQPRPEEPAVALQSPPVAGDPLRVRTPPSGAPPLLPLQWGTVQPGGWIRDWAETAARGAVSPTNSWFASGKAIPITSAQHTALMNNGTDYPPGVGRANGWKDGQPAHPWTMAEQSAYWIDGMTRLGLVLNNSALKVSLSNSNSYPPPGLFCNFPVTWQMPCMVQYISPAGLRRAARSGNAAAYCIHRWNILSFSRQARTAEDITSVIKGGVLNEPNGGPEGWPRSVYSRAMLVYAFPLPPHIYPRFPYHAY
eukprot:COSAG05_NODE_1023_length_6126_cov_6.196117_8_plen_298_part_00